MCVCARARRARENIKSFERRRSGTRGIRRYFCQGTNIFSRRDRIIWALLSRKIYLASLSSGRTRSARVVRSPPSHHRRRRPRETITFTYYYRVYEPDVTAFKKKNETTSDRNRNDHILRDTYEYNRPWRESPTRIFIAIGNRLRKRAPVRPRTGKLQK